MTDSDLSNDWTDPPADSTLSPNQIVYAAHWGQDVLPSGAPNPGTSAIEVFVSGVKTNGPLANIATAWIRLNAPIIPPNNSRCRESKPMGARLRLLRGSVFEGQVLTPPPARTVEPNSGGVIWGGRGASLPLVVEAWPRANMIGGDAPRPIVKMPVNNLGEGTAPCWDMTGGTANSFQPEWGGDIWVVGLEITSQSIPGGVGAGWVPVKPASAFVKKGSTGARYLFEDLYIHNVGTAFEIDGGDSNHPDRKIRGLTIRRCVLMDMWQRNLNWGEGNPEGSTSGGAYFGSVKWGLIEDNFWDKCGWNHLQNHPVVVSTDTRTPPLTVVNPMAPKNVFSQGMYMPASSEHMLVRNNIMSRPPHAGIQSRGRNQRIVNNLVLEAPMAIALGHAQNQGKWNPVLAQSELSEPPDPLKYWRGECKYNVVLNGANVDRWIVNAVCRVDPNNANSQICGQMLGEVEIDGDPRGSGIVLTRCRRFGGQLGDGDSLDYYENTGGPGGTAPELVKAAHVYRNLVAFNEDGRSPQGAALYINDDQEPKANPTYVRRYSALVQENVFYDWLGVAPNGSYCINIDNSKTLVQQPQGQVPNYGPPDEGLLGPGFQFVNNYFVQNGLRTIGRMRFIDDSPINERNGSWTGNQYYALLSLQGSEPKLGFRVQAYHEASEPALADQPSAFIEYQGRAGWQAGTGEPSQSMLAFLPEFTDSERSLARYMQDVLGFIPPNTGIQGDVVHAYMLKCRTQSRGSTTWNPLLQAKYVNAYMRAGFNIPEE